MPNVMPLDPNAYKAMSLSVPNADITVNIHTAIRTHFGRLPELITTKMTKLGWPQERIPKITMSNDEDPHNPSQETEEGEGEEEDDDTKFSFHPDHIVSWWSHYLSLPPEIRPVFVPSAGFRDTFQLMSERTLVGLLWGGKPDNPGHPTRNIMERHIFSYEAADAAVKNNYGEIIFKLFIGNREEIRQDRMKQQTSYGKRTTTMATLATQDQGFSRPSLKRHMGEYFAYMKAKKAAKDTGTSISLAEPVLPSSGKPSMRYALSNCLTTDGLQLHVNAFDTSKSWATGKKRFHIPTLEQRFPDPQAMGAFEDTVVVGVDPGEIISAAFCMIDPKAPKQVSNLSVRRTALYSPTLAYRTRLEDLKRRQRTTVSTGDSSILWTSDHPSEAMIGEHELNQHTVELPTINETEQSLGQATFESMEHHNDILRQFALVFEGLTGFYSAKSLKKLQWEKTKAMRAERDLAVHGAIRMIPTTHGQPRPALFVYGDGKFKLTTLHETFRTTS
ncbi:hypothetical protein BGZ65_008581 [Modicella reniformis]|uniref:Uncharacterized protein n=1 Tax=Modicella reniformis TaxID=1440133 RepID=A0A9P6LTQ2_9FUNG|nr:hypothetical protein BGZ65_008581 [Modicella reniformis]